MATQKQTHPTTHPNATPIEPGGAALLTLNAALVDALDELARKAADFAAGEDALRHLKAEVDKARARVADLRRQRDTEETRIYGGG